MVPQPNLNISAPAHTGQSLHQTMSFYYFYLLFFVCFRTQVLPKMQLFIHRKKLLINIDPSRRHSSDASNIPFHFILTMTLNIKQKQFLRTSFHRQSPNSKIAKECKSNSSREVHWLIELSCLNTGKHRLSKSVSFRCSDFPPNSLKKQAPGIIRDDKLGPTVQQQVQYESWPPECIK